MQTSEETNALPCVGCRRRAMLALIVPGRPERVPLCRACFERFAALVDLAERLTPASADRRG